MTETSAAHTGTEEQRDASLRACDISAIASTHGFSYGYCAIPDESDYNDSICSYLNSLIRT